MPEVLGTVKADLPGPLAADPALAAGTAVATAAPAAPSSAVIELDSAVSVELKR
jgi:hypothetical protein